MAYFVAFFDEFEFESGAVLKDVKVEYFLTGTPKYDEEGNITNMVLYFHVTFWKRTFRNGP